MVVGSQSVIQGVVPGCFSLVDRYPTGGVKFFKSVLWFEVQRV